MNGEATDSADSLGSSYSSLRSITSISSQNYSSPRLRRLEDMKKSYVLNGGPSPSSTFSSPMTGYVSKFAQSMPHTVGTRAYRLASLDRLADRHKLYDADGLEIVDSNGSEVTINGNSTSRTSPTRISNISPTKLTVNGSLSPVKSPINGSTTMSISINNTNISPGNNSINKNITSVILPINNNSDDGIGFIDGNVENNATKMVTQSIDKLNVQKMTRITSNPIGSPEDVQKIPLASNSITTTSPEDVQKLPRISSNYTSPKDVQDSAREYNSTYVKPYSSATSTNYSHYMLQNKRDMFFKAEPNGGGIGSAPTATLTHPSTAPPAPPSSTPPIMNGISPHPNITVTLNNSISTTIPHSFQTTNSSSIVTTTSTAAAPHKPAAPPTTKPAVPPTPAPKPTLNAANHTASSVATIKEQLLISKEKKPDSKEDDQKENKVLKRKPREVDGYVGFVNLPNQVYRKAVKRGFEFSLMVVGESGLGKSTLINSMFLTDIYSNEYPGPSQRVKKTVQVETTKTLLKENGVNLSLTVVDTPGFGDAVDNSDCWQPVTDYIESKYDAYLTAESKVNRKEISDSRVHCCLYFIAPSGHGLKPLDVEFMRRLHDRVNIIPVIAKADNLTPEECQHLKKQILNEISQHKIKIYEFPDDEGDGISLKMKSKVPFAVVGSNTLVEVDGKKVRGRKYPWGIVEVENEDHCDFIALRNMMIRTHMQDLKDVTNNVHYENFRYRKLAGVGNNEAKLRNCNKNPIAQIEDEKREHTNRMKKMETEMEQVFEMKVKEKMNKLHDLEGDLEKRNESMRKKLESDFSDINEERDRFLKEKQAWEAANNVTIDELRRRSLESISREQVDGKKKRKGLF